MKRGLIIINAYMKLEHGLNQATRLKEEFEHLGITMDIKRNDCFFASIEEDGSICSAATEYDFCVYLDKDKYVSESLEKTGLRLFNSHAAMIVCDDKMTTAIALANHGIPMPKTLPGLLCYDEKERVAEQTLNEIEGRLGYPLILKTSYGSLGKGVFLIENREQLQKKSEELKCVPHLYQQFVRTSFGRDVRVIVIGKRCVGAMLRTSAGDFRSNLELGGSGMPYDLPDSSKRLCERIAQILDLDYCGIDLLFGERNFLVCEVNSNAFFGGMERVGSVNIARLYAEYICQNTYRSQPLSEEVL